MWLFYYFKFERNYDALKSKSPCILLNKNMNLIKTKRNLKWKTPDIVLERLALCFSSYKTRKLKVKLWWVGGRKRKKRAFFVPFILPDGNFFKNCVLSQCLVYWVHSQNILTFTNQKILLHCCLFLKSSKAFSVSLNSFVIFLVWSFLNMSNFVYSSFQSFSFCCFFMRFPKKHSC